MMSYIPVTPYAGVWIEILSKRSVILTSNVTPYAGVWIEIFVPVISSGATLSLPTRECGLK